MEKLLAPPPPPDFPEQLAADEHRGSPESVVGNGLNYWTADVPAILSEAVSRANSLRQQQSPERQLPSWATATLRNPDKLRSRAAIFSRHLQIESRPFTGEGSADPNQSPDCRMVGRWYRRLGPTNTDPDLAPLLLAAAQSLEKQPLSADRDLLIGELVEDAALRISEPKGRLALLHHASRLYHDVAGGNLTTPTVRAASRRQIDCAHQILRLRHASGQISDSDFYRAYEQLQTESARRLNASLERDQSAPADGELLEWASLIFLRHRYWSDETAEHYDVRSALRREDQAIYPWPVEYGANPIWSFDTLVQPARENAEPLRIQLKAGIFRRDSERYRAYLPTVVEPVVSQLTADRLRQLVKHGLQAVTATYKSIHEMSVAPGPVDEAAIRQLEGIFSGAERQVH